MLLTKKYYKDGYYLFAGDEASKVSYALNLIDLKRQVVERVICSNLANNFCGATPEDEIEFQAFLDGHSWLQFDREST